MYLSRLFLNARSREFRRDHADAHRFHRLIMSRFPQYSGTAPARQSYGALWRLEQTEQGFALYVQSREEPKWDTLPPGYLVAPAQIRSLQPVLDAITPGRKLSFRMNANPTRLVRSEKSGDKYRATIRDQREQIQWLVRKGEQHGFVLPAGGNGEPDVAPLPLPRLTGRAKPGIPLITVDQVRFDGHLVVTSAELLREAIQTGIGRAKAYGCGLLSLAPARRDM
jgi:CRISPR system Cascade subunit CasE